jgi:hypothetical protein
VEMLCCECSLNMAVTAQDYRTGVQAKSILHHPGRGGFTLEKGFYCGAMGWFGN